MAQISDAGLMLGLVASMIGGGVGARNNGAAFWKGAIVAIAPNVVFAVCAAGGINVGGVYQLVFSLLAFVTAATILGLTRRQSGATFVGCLLFGFVAVYVVAPFLDKTV